MREVSGKRRLAVLCAFVLACLAVRSAFLRPPPPAESPGPALNVPQRTLDDRVRALLSNSPGGGAPGGLPVEDTAPASSRPERPWSSGSKDRDPLAGGHDFPEAAGLGAASAGAPSARLAQAPPWQLPPANGGFRPTAGASAGAPGSAASALPPAPNASGRRKPAPSAAAKKAAAARAEPGAGPGFDGSVQTPNARPSGDAGRKTADPDELGPERTMGGRSGNPRTRPAPVEEPAPPPPDDDAASTAQSASGAVSSGGSSNPPKTGAEPAASGDNPDGPGKSARRRHGHVVKIPDAGDSASPAADPAAPPAPPAAPPADPEEETPDPTNPGPHQHVLAQVTPIVGAPQIGAGTPVGSPYSATEGGAPTVQPVVVQTLTGKAIEYPAGLPPDPNGAGGWHRVEGAGTRVTALQYPDGKNLNPGTIPYVVIPPNFPGVKLGDYAAVTYGGRTVFAIVGDYGPAGVVGGGSLVLASGLGIDPDPKNGGVSSGVTYIILPGSAGATIPANAAAVEANGKASFTKAGITFH